MKYTVFAFVFAFLFTACQNEPTQPTEKVLAKVVSKVEKKPMKESPAPIYASYDYGASWEPMNDIFHDSIGITRLDKIGNQVIASTFNAGIFLENKSGKQWKQISEGLPKRQVNALHVSGERIFVGLYKSGIYCSDDKGDSWESLSYNLADLRVQSILKNKNQLFIGTDSGVFEYIETEKRWKQLFPDVQVNSLKTYEDKIMAATNKGVLLSEDQGKNWEWIYQKGAVFSATILDGGTLMISRGGDMYRSKDWGKTWKDLFYFPKDNFGVFETIQLGQYLIMSHQNGIFRSSDDGDVWFKMFKEVDIPFSELLVKDKVIYASYANGGNGC